MAARAVEVRFPEVQEAERAVEVHQRALMGFPESYEERWRGFFHDAIQVGCSHQEAVEFADAMARD